MSDLPELQECVLDILKALPERPRRLRLEVGSASIELDWPDSVSAAASPASLAPVAPAPSPDPGQPDRNVVSSPSVGTFYRAVEPGASPFVVEGDVVRPGQQIAIVEVMKLMLPVEADRAGRVIAILKANGDPVEYGEPLIELSPPGEVS